MVPEVRKYHIEASKKVSPDHQSYGIQYDGKGPAKFQQNKQRNQNTRGTIQEDNKNNDDNKNDKEGDNQNYAQNQFLGFQPRQQKMHKSIEDTSYVDDTEMYTKNNQYKVTSDKDNLAYIESASDTVVIGGDA